MKYWICMMLALMLIVPISAEAADNARAWLDRNTMQMGETVTLNVEVEGGSASQPDFSVLDSDFNTLGTQSSRQMSLVNGSASSKTVWAIGLEPRHAGSLTIPAFDIGSAKTQPLVLVVMPAATTRQGAAGDAIFITVDAQPLSPYVQQQIRLTVKLHFSVDLSEGALDEPAIDSAHVQKLGRDKQYATNLNGRRYQVLERNYAITPEHSGALEIPGLNFRGSALDNTDPGSFFRRGRAVSARSEALAIEVRGRPASWGNAPWLPAQALSITDETTLPDEVALGEPLTRTVKLRAQGLGFEQLPELEMPALAGADVYADKSETRTRDDGTWLYGERTRKFAVVASRLGTLVLPEMRVQWWDTTNDRMETAVLPEHSVRVVAAGTSSTPAGGQSSAADAISGSAAPAASTTPIIYPGAADAASTQHWRLLSFLFAGLWLATVLLWWRSRRKPPRPAAAHVRCTGRRWARCPSCVRARWPTWRKRNAPCWAGRACTIRTCAIWVSSHFCCPMPINARRSSRCNACATRETAPMAWPRIWHARSARVSPGFDQAKTLSRPLRCRRCIRLRARQAEHFRFHDGDACGTLGVDSTQAARADLLMNQAIVARRSSLPRTGGAQRVVTA
jgi:hypothetical protein